MIQAILILGMHKISKKCGPGKIRSKKGGDQGIRKSPDFVSFTPRTV